MESVGRIRLSRAPHMKYKWLLSNGAQSIGKALEHFRRVAEQTDSPLVRAVADEREDIYEATHFLRTPYAPPGKGLAPPMPFGVLRTLSRMVKDAARAETPFWRVCDARYGYMLKYNMPMT